MKPLASIALAVLASVLCWSDATAQEKQEMHQMHQMHQMGQIPTVKPELPRSEERRVGKECRL